VPTTRRRHIITETDRIASVLDDAAKRWPDEERRAMLLVRLVEEGHRALMERREQEEGIRRAAVAQTSGALTGLYGKDYLQDLREDWPG
jgi:hypothetical protein